MEWAASVDLLSGSEDSLLLEIGDSVATPVAAVVVGSTAWASVRGSPPGVLVSLHDIHLWAPLSGDVVGIAVVVAISVVWLAISSDSWECHGVEGSDTAASHLAEIDVVLDGSIKEFGLEEAIWVQGWGLREGGSSVVGAVHASSAGAALRGHVEGLVLSINLDSDGVEAVDSGVAGVGVSELLLGLDHTEASEGESGFHLVKIFIII